MDKQHYDVIIVGGGLVGMACALGLSQRGVAVCLIESQTRSPITEVPQAADSWDSRIYALSPANADWLAMMGVWELLDASRICPISEMDVYGDASSNLHFHAYEAQLDNLGFIVESEHLLQALTTAFNDSQATLMSGVAPTAVSIIDKEAEIHFSGQSYTADLLVAADGAQSWLRRNVGVHVREHDYRQMGVVANFETESPHHQVAYQWFSEQGVLAWLPLPGRRISMVWSVDEAFARHLLALDPQSLADLVSGHGESKLGKLTMITPPQAFPLKQQTAEKMVLPNLALIGDAAHTVHPLAGQGVNLGFRDVKALIETLNTKKPQQRYGDLMLLRHYERSRKADMMAIKTMTRGLFELFSHANPLAEKLRNLGLNLVNQQAKIKKQLMRHATR